MQRHVASRSGAICRYADGLVRAKIDAYGCCGGRIRSVTQLACPVQPSSTSGHGTVCSMRELLILAVHLLVTCAKLLRSGRSGGSRAVAAESLLLKRQLLISNRSRQRAPNLTTLDRFVLGLTTLFVNPRRIAKLGA